VTKLEINSQMRPTTRKLKNSKKERISYKDIFKEYQKENKKKFYPSELNSLRKRKSTDTMEHVDFFLFKKIISTFVRVFITDLYKKKESYFFFGGRIAITALSPKYRKNIGISSLTFSYVWYNRPSERFWYMVRLLKVLGNSKIVKLEQEMKEANIIDNFPNFKKLKRKLRKSNLLYKCIQK